MEFSIRSLAVIIIILIVALVIANVILSMQGNSVSLFETFMDSVMGFLGS